MDQEAEMFIRRIYSNDLEISLLDQLINHLRNFFTGNNEVLEPIHLIGNYFSVFHVSHPTRIVLFAGAVDAKQQGERFPILRVDRNNESLQLMNGFTFPYYKDNQITNTENVILCKDTIDLIPRLLNSQLVWFTTQR